MFSFLLRRQKGKALRLKIGDDLNNCRNEVLQGGILLSGVSAESKRSLRSLRLSGEKDEG